MYRDSRSQGVNGKSILASKLNDDESGFTRESNPNHPQLILDCSPIDLSYPRESNLDSKMQK